MAKLAIAVDAVDAPAVVDAAVVVDAADAAAIHCHKKTVLAHAYFAQWEFQHLSSLFVVLKMTSLMMVKFWF